MLVVMVIVNYFDLVVYVCLFGVLFIYIFVICDICMEVE